MKKKVILSLFLVVFLCGSLSLLKGSEKQDLWIKAAAEKDPQIKLQLFEEFKAKFEDPNDKNIKFLYFNLAQTSFFLQKFEKTIEYGEHALTFVDLEDQYKLEIALWLSNAYNLARKDYDKAYSYADMVLNLAKSIKDITDGRNQSEEVARGIDKNFIAPSLRIQLRILCIRGITDNKKRLEVIQKSIAAHKADSSVEFAKRTVLKESVELAKAELVNEAINAIEQVVDQNDLSYDEANLLAQLYYRRYSKSKTADDKDKAIDYYIKAYNKNKASTMAVKIGQLLYKKDNDKAIEFFAEGYILAELDKASDAFKYLQQLWFKEKAKDRSLEEQEAGFQEIIAAAKTRLGKM